MKKKNIAIIIVILVLLILGFALKVPAYLSSKTNKDVSTLYLNNKKTTLKEGDKFNADAWNSRIDATLNDERINSIPVLFNGVTFGTKVKNVIKKFNIKSGYARINAEVASGSSGNTDIVNTMYEDYNSLPKDFLDYGIIFGYKKIEKGWEMVRYADIDNADIIYNIDICGFDDERYGYNEVIGVYINYLSEEDKEEEQEEEYHDEIGEVDDNGYGDIYEEN